MKKGRKHTRVLSPQDIDRLVQADKRKTYALPPNEATRSPNNTVTNIPKRADDHEAYLELLHRLREEFSETGVWHCASPTICDHFNAIFAILDDNEADLGDVRYRMIQIVKHDEESRRRNAILERQKKQEQPDTPLSSLALSAQAQFLESIWRLDGLIQESNGLLEAVARGVQEIRSLYSMHDDQGSNMAAVGNRVRALGAQAREIFSAITPDSVRSDSHRITEIKTEIERICVSEIDGFTSLFDECCKNHASCNAQLDDARIEINRLCAETEGWWKQFSERFPTIDLWGESTDEERENFGSLTKDFADVRSRVSELNTVFVRTKSQCEQIKKRLEEHKTSAIAALEHIVSLLPEENEVSFAGEKDRSVFYGAIVSLACAGDMTVSKARLYKSLTEAAITPSEEDARVMLPDLIFAMLRDLRFYEPTSLGHMKPTEKASWWTTNRVVAVSQSEEAALKRFWDNLKSKRSGTTFRVVPKEPEPVSEILEFVNRMNELQRLLMMTLGEFEDMESPPMAEHILGVLSYLGYLTKTAYLAEFELNRLTKHGSTQMFIFDVNREDGPTKVQFKLTDNGKEAIKILTSQGALPEQLSAWSFLILAR